MILSLIINYGFIEIYKDLILIYYLLLRDGMKPLVNFYTSKIDRIQKYRNKAADSKIPTPKFWHQSEQYSKNLSSELFASKM